MLEKRAGDRLRRRADIDEERRLVGDARRGGAADRLLLIARDHAARVVADVLHARRQDRAAVDARQQPLVAKLVQILADRLRRDFETLRKLVHHDAARLPRHLKDRVLPGDQHAKPLTHQNEAAKQIRNRKQKEAPWQRNAYYPAISRKFATSAAANSGALMWNGSSTS